VTKLTRRSRHSLIHLAIEDDSRSESFLNQDQNKVAHIADLRTAQPKLSQRRRIGVIIDCYRKPGSPRQIGSKRPIAPFEMRNKQRGRRLGIDQPRHAHAYAFNVAVCSDELLYTRSNLAKGGAHIGIRFKLFPVHDSTCQIRDGDSCMRSADVDADRHRRCRAQSQ